MQISRVQATLEQSHKVCLQKLDGPKWDIVPCYKNKARREEEKKKALLEGSPTYFASSTLNGGEFIAQFITEHCLYTVQQFGMNAELEEIGEINKENTDPTNIPNSVVGSLLFIA